MPGQVGPARQALQGGDERLGLGSQSVEGDELLDEKPGEFPIGGKVFSGTRGRTSDPARP